MFMFVFFFLHNVKTKKKKEKEEKEACMSAISSVIFNLNIQFNKKNLKTRQITLTNF